jgi:hypothetical protein
MSASGARHGGVSRSGRVCAARDSVINVKQTRPQLAKTRIRAAPAEHPKNFKPEAARPKLPYAFARFTAKEQGLARGVLQASTWKELSMALKHIVAGLALAALTTPAAADFYVVQDTSTKRCTIVEQKPTTTTTVVVGGGTFTSRTEAETAMKKVEVCSSGMSTGTTGSSTTTTTTTTK